jgi:hypothetical protein
VQSGSISVFGEADFYGFSGDAGDELALTLVQLTGFGADSSQKARVTLFAPSGAEGPALLANGEQRVTLAETGAYLLRVVGGASRQTTGTYNLGLECTAAGSGDPVAIVNASFEAEVLADAEYVFAIPGWSFEAGDDVGTFDPHAGAYPGGAPDGENVAFIGAGCFGCVIEQTLSASLLPDTVYTLEVEVGRRSDIAGQSLGFLVGLAVESTGVASVGAPMPAPGTFETARLTYVSPSAGAIIGQPLRIQLGAVTGPNVQFNFDAVRLLAAPLGGGGP